MVQLTFAPCTFPNKELEELLLAEADKYIKEKKLTMGGVMYTPSYVSELDYRLSAFSNRKESSREQLGGWGNNEEQVFYRIFVDKRAALEFIKLNLNVGAKKARIITEDQCGVVEGIPKGIQFPTNERVQQFLWNRDEDINKRVQFYTLA